MPLPTYTTTQILTGGGEALGVCYDDAGHVWNCDLTGNAVYKYDVATLALLATVTLTNPTSCCFDSGTGTVWVRYGGSGDQIAKIDPVANTVIGSYSGGTVVGQITSDGTRIWCCNSNDDTVTVLLALDGSLVATVPVGNSPNGVCFDGLGSVWVTNQFGPSVTKITAATQAVIGTYTVGNQPISIAFDGTDIWVTDGGYSPTFLQSLERISVSTGAVLNTYPLGDDGTLDTFFGLAWDQSTGVLWMCDGGGNAEHNFLYAIDVSNGTIIATYDGYPNGETIFVCIAGTSIWASNGNLGALTVLTAPTPPVVVEAWLVIREPSLGLTDRSNYLFKSDGAQHSWTQELRQRGQATVDLVVPSGDAYSPTRSTQLFLYDQVAAGFIRVFAGIIQDVEDKWLDNAGERRLAVTAMSMESVFDTVYADYPVQYVDQTCGFILTDLFNKFESGCPVTLGVIDAGETIPLFNVNKGDRLSGLFTQLATTSLFTWGVDPVDITLNFRGPASDPAPFTLESDDVLWDTPNWKVRGADFRNRQGVRVSFDAFPHAIEFFPVSAGQQNFTLRNPVNQVVKCYVTLSTCNTATGAFTGVPSPGDTVTVGPINGPWIANHFFALGGQIASGGFIFEVTVAGTTGATLPTFDNVTGSTTNDFTVVWTCRGPSGFSTGTYIYTWVATLDNTQFGQVLIGATVAACVQNLADAINAAPLARRVTISLPTWENSQCNAISITGTGFTLQQKSAGSGWVSSISATGTAFSWSSNTTSGGTSPNGSVGPNLGATADIGVFAIGTSSAPDSLVYTPGSASVYLTTPRGVTPVGLNIEYTRSDGDVTEVEDTALITATATLTGGTGVYAQFTDQSSTGLISTSAESALQLIQQALAAFKVPPATFRFDTFRPGLRAGMVLTAVLTKPIGASALLNGDWLIESIDASLIEPAKVPYLTPVLGHYRYTVSCVNVAQIGSWLDYWNGGGGGGGGNSSLVATSGGAVGTGAQPALALEVNGAANSSQATLNLEDGTCIAVTDAGAGSVSVALKPYAQPFSSVASIVVTHNLGTVNVIVAVYDSTGAHPVRITPTVEEITDANTVTITLGASTSGYVVVIGG